MLAEMTRFLRHIRSFVTEDMAASIPNAMVLSCLDYSNSLLFGCSFFNIAKLQRIQNTAAGIVLKLDGCAVSTSCCSACTGYQFISVSSIR